MMELLTTMIDGLVFYQAQVFTGTVAGAACAVLGVFVLLNRQALFAATMSQAATFAFAVVTVLHGLGAHGAGNSHPQDTWQTPLLATIFMIPFFLMRRRGRFPDAALVGGIVLYSAASQILTVTTGLHTHLLAAYFGNILTVSDTDLAYTLPIVAICTVLFVLLYRSFVAVSFDRDHARLAGLRATAIETSFFVILCVLATLTIRLLGAFFALAHLVLPALAALAVSRSIATAVLIAFVISVTTTVLGFGLSLFPISLAGGAVVNLPTSSVIILLLCFCAVVPIFRRA